MRNFNLTGEEFSHFKRFLRALHYSILSHLIEQCFLNFLALVPLKFWKCFCTPRPIEQTPTKLPVNIQSNNEITHNVACSQQNQFCRNKQEAIYYVTVTLSYDKKSFRNADVKKGFGKRFLISNNIENKFLANSLRQPLF